MTKLFKILPLFLVLTVFTNCTESSQGAKPAQAAVNRTLPSWYSQPPQNNSSLLHGLGQGDDRKKAIHDALNDAVATLNISVSSSYTHETNVDNTDGTQRYSKKTRENVDIVIKEIELNNYKVIEHQLLADNTHVVLIQINKHALFTSLYNTLKNSFTMLDAALKNKDQKLEKILIYHKYLAKFKNQTATLNILSALDPSFDGEEFTSDYKKVLSEYSAMVENKLFKVETDDLSQKYINQITYGILQDGLKLASNNSGHDYLIHIEATEKENVAVRREVVYLLKTTISIGISDSKENKEISFTTFNLESESDVSTEKARESNREKLKQKIDEYGIFNIPNA